MSTIIVKTVIFTIAIVFIATGIGISSIIRTPFIREYVIDYTDCIKEYSDENITCKEFKRKENETCICFYDFNLTEDFGGKVIMYYELESFNQLRNDYIMSRDDSQLQGVLNTIPSENCGTYRYNEDNIPIAPCGLVADTFFNDSFAILDKSLNEYVNFKPTGMLTDADKIGFRNPENITEAKKLFAKPMSWRKSIWELDLNNTENNGFQNEVFIGWMKTDWKRKPRALFTKTLAIGSYTLRVAYHYPSSLYDGQRKLILQSTSLSVNTKFILFGSILFMLGIFIVSGLIFIMKKQ